MKRHGIERREPHADFQSGSKGANAFDDLPEKACTIFKTAAIIALARARAQKLMSQIAVAMFDVYKIKANLMGEARGLMKGGDDFTNLAIGQHRIISRQSDPLVEQRVMIK